MKLTRRKTLAILGGGVIFAAAGTGYAISQSPRTALKPWTNAGQYEDPRMRALSYAILAPNPHNRQPWIVDLNTPDLVELYVDPDRLLPHTDPFSRQIVVGLGCFLELMTLAAAKEGYRVSLSLFPDGEDANGLDQRRVAVARFEQIDVQAESALFDHVLARRSLKDPYDTTQPVSQEALDTLVAAVTRGSAVAASNEEALVQDLRELTTDALEIEIKTPRTYKESVDLFRIGYREVDANPDGIAFTGARFEALRLTGLFSRKDAMDENSVTYKAGLDLERNSAQSGMAYIWLNTQGNSRTEQIMAGRDWVRLNLAATAIGLGVHPMSQALQEFPEMSALFDKAHQILAPGGGVVQMLGRLGYGPQVAQSPRWLLKQKVRSG
ncbi:MAG: twin-arginine translocation pathway signal protein [Paracoccaceae bacterium]